MTGVLPYTILANQRARNCTLHTATVGNTRALRAAYSSRSRASECWSLRSSLRWRRQLRYARGEPGQQYKKNIKRVVGYVGECITFSPKHLLYP